MNKLTLLIIIVTLCLNSALAQHYIIFHAYPASPLNFDFTGHAFVSFITKDNVNQQTIVDAKWGFRPVKNSPKVDAFFVVVSDNMKEDWTTTSKFDFIVKVERDDVYKRCLQVKDIWDAKNYSAVAGQTCVDFVRDIAYRIPGVVIPPSAMNLDLWQWPKDFLLALKKLNPKIDSESRKSLLKVSPISNANEKKLTNFTWHSDCTYKGIYDANTYALSRLKNTALLCNFELNLTFDYRVVMEEPGNTTPYSKVDIPRLDAEYKRKSAWFKSAEFVSGVYWQQLKNRRLRELDQDYELLRIGMLYNSNPDVLKNNRFSNICDKYVIALTSEDPILLLNTWRKLVDDNIKNNGDVNILEKDFQKKISSPYKMQWAKHEVLIYGWQKCANTKIERVIEDGSSQEQFKKLFIRIDESECDY